MTASQDIYCLCVTGAPRLPFRCAALPSSISTMLERLLMDFVARKFRSSLEMTLTVETGGEPFYP